MFLEAEWVLRSVFGFTPAEIAEALTDFAGLPHVTLENAPIMATALDWPRREWISPMRFIL